MRWVSWLPAISLVAACVTESGTFQVSQPEDLGVSHLEQDVVQAIVDGTEDPPTYSSVPATSGPHAPVATPCGIYRQEVPEIFNIHTLEHGAVIFYYKSDLLGAEQRDQLEGLARELATHVIVMPYQELSVPLAFVSWGNLAEMSRFDPEAARSFWGEYAQRGPESGIACPLAVDEAA